jgi:DNA-binding beta-propeller fold protein YncE
VPGGPVPVTACVASRTARTVNPVFIAITPDGKTAYVVSGGITGTVTPIRTATNTALHAINVGSRPGAISISP